MRQHPVTSLTPPLASTSAGYNCLYIAPGHDNEGRPIVVCVASRFPSKNDIPHERLFLYLVRLLHNLTTQVGRRWLSGVTPSPCLIDSVAPSRLGDRLGIVVLLGAISRVCVHRATPLHVISLC